MLDLLTSFVAELRAAGLPVSLTESLDAAQALKCLALDDRETLKAALGATLVKSEAHWRAFDTAFEIYFSSGRSGGIAGNLEEELSALSELIDGDSADVSQGSDMEADDGSGQRFGTGGVREGLGPQEIRELLMAALLRGNDAQVRAITRHAVTRFAGMESGRPVGGTYYLYRTLRYLDFDCLFDRLLSAMRAQAPDDTWTPLEELLGRDELRIRMERLRSAVEEEIRRRLVVDRGAKELARSVRKTLPEDMDFMHVSADEMVQLRRAVAPLARKLAVRLARKRRHGHRGSLDFRATVRQSLSTGGVPIDPRFRYPKPSKPELVIIADISGSVAAFARFTLHLVHALSAEFSKVRSFVFVDGIDEVTAYFDGVVDVAEAIHRINAEASVVWMDGHSDYGHALTMFWERWGTELTPRTSVMLLGDARNNYHSSGAWVLKEIAGRARRVSWLNPEPKGYWGSGDSIIGEYAAFCDEVIECRNLRQLERFVSEMA